MSRTATGSCRTTVTGSRDRIVRVLAMAAVIYMVAMAPGVAHSASSGSTFIPTGGPTLSTTDRLADRRYVAAGTRAYDVGSEDGRYPAAGWHIQGEMGGIWTPPLKLLDGIWFGVDDQWLPPATSFSSGYGYVQMQLPEVTGLSSALQISRVDFVPDGRRAVIIGLQFTAPRGTVHFTLKVNAHSELMKAYPWGWTNPSQTDYNLPDQGAFNGSQLVFTEDGQSPGETAPHHWAALVGSSLTPSGGAAAATCAPGAPCFRGPQDPPVICPASGTTPYRCDDSAFGKGAGGELRYDLTIPEKSTQTVWFVVAGSDEGLAAAQSEFSAALADPAAELTRKIAGRQQLAGQTNLSLPGDPLLAQGIDWGKQNLADLRQEARNLQLRITNQGTQYPTPVGTLPQIDFIGAGFPDYPWLFATDGEYTAFASVGVGQFSQIEAHLRALRDVSDIVNNRSGKVVHETVTDGSVYYGTNGDPGNVDETVKFPTAVALVWRWTGDKAFLDDMYDFTRRTMRYAFTLDGPDMDNWLDGPGNVERAGMGQEKLDVAVYTIRGLLDLAEMANAEKDMKTAQWAGRKASAMEKAFEQAWWLKRPGTPSYADSLADPPLAPENTQLYQRYWIGVTPMEAQLWQNGHVVPGLAVPQHANPALDLRESICFGDPNGPNPGIYHTGTGTADPPPDPDSGADPTCDTSVSSVPDEEDIFTLNSAVMAVGEGNYGRLGPAQQQRFTTANRQLQLPNPDEQPGAMPEIAPSPEYGRSIDKPFTARATVMQAWGNYGTVWPVVSQQLGVRPDLGNGNLEVVPQVPPQEQGQTISGSNILLGSGSNAGSIDVGAYAGGHTYRTTVTLRLPAHLTIGHTIPLGATPASVTLDGAPALYTIRDTNRGREVLVDAGSSEGPRTLVVTTG